MKAKISATVDRPLVDFLDSLPGNSRSEKLELALRRIRSLEEEKRLRKQLIAYAEGEGEQAEREAWERTVAEAMWNE
jgi:hypothetical protein